MDTTDKEITCISLFTGGGFLELGVRRVLPNLRVLAYVEIEAYAVARLAKKIERGELDEAPIFTDVTTFPSEAFRDKVHLVVAGYPCQDFSCAGKRKGLEGKRGKMWGFTRSVISGLRARAFFGENVDGHVSLGLDTVISDLGEDGFAVKGGIYSAREVGAGHLRKRVFTLSYRCDPRSEPWDRFEPLADSMYLGSKRGSRPDEGRSSNSIKGRGALPLADSHLPRDGASECRIDSNREKEIERRKEQSQSKSGGFSELADPGHDGGNQGHGEATDKAGGEAGSGEESLHEGREASPNDIGTRGSNIEGEATEELAYDPCWGYGGWVSSRSDSKRFSCGEGEIRSEGGSETRGGDDDYARGSHEWWDLQWPAPPGPQYAYEPPRVIPSLSSLDDAKGSRRVSPDDERKVSGSKKGKHTVWAGKQSKQGLSAESGLGGVDNVLTSWIHEAHVNREHRLRMLGNGVVWLTAAKAYTELHQAHIKQIESRE